MFMNQLSRLPLLVEILNIIWYVYDFWPCSLEAFLIAQFTTIVSIPWRNSRSLMNSKVQYFKNNLSQRLFTNTLSVQRSVIIFSYLPSVTPDNIISYCCGTVFSRLHRLLTLPAKIIDMHVYSNSALGWTFPLLRASLSNICPMVVWNQ